MLKGSCKFAEVFQPSCGFIICVIDPKIYSRPGVLGREHTCFVVPPKFSQKRPLLLLLRGVCRDGFPSRSKAVFTLPAAVRFQPMARLSEGKRCRATPAPSTRLLTIVKNFSRNVKIDDSVNG